MATGQLNGVIQHLRRAMLLRDGAGLTDQQLLEDYIRRRDEAALAALVQRHGPMVWGVCRRVLSNYHDAEDAFQATFLVLVRRAASIASPELLANWLYGVAHQTALKARATVAKRKMRERQVTEMPEPAGVEQDLWNDLQPLLDQELSRLPDKYRGVIVLCDLEGMTRKEAAGQLGCAEGTVASRLARARIMLAKRLKGRGAALSGGALAAVLAQQAASAGVPSSVVDSTIKAASLVGAGKAAATGVISVKVAALTEGVMKAMLFTKLKAAIAVVLILGFVATGATILTCHTAAAQGDQPPAAEAPVKVPEKETQDLKTRDKLGWIGSAMQSYFDTHKVYPGPALYGKDGKPLLSWRVALLPYLNEGDLYRQFRLDEPWDTAHNKQLLARMPDVYRGTGARDGTATPFQVFVGMGTMFEGPSGLGYRDIPDGISNTIAVVEATGPVRWTKPEDLPYSATGKLPELGGELPDLTYALFADGKVHALKRRFDADALRVAITRDDGLPTPFGKLLAPAPTLDEREKETFTAWGKEVGGLQAGLGFRPGEKRVYHHREGVAVVLRVRNVGKEAVEFDHIWAFFVENPPTITGADGKVIQLPGGKPLGLQRPRSVNIAPGQEVALFEWGFDLRPQGDSGNKGSLTIQGSGKFSLQCERIVGPTFANPNHPNPAMSKLATGKLELEIKEEVKGRQNQDQKQEKEAFTAWGKDFGGLQAGLGFRPGEKRAYSHGETVNLVVRARNVSKEDVKIQYLKEFFRETSLAVTDSKGKQVLLREPLDTAVLHIPVEVNLAPGKEIELYERMLVLSPAYGTGTVQIQYERVFGNSSFGRIKLDPTLSKLATGKLELEVKEKEAEKLPEKQEKEGFTAWGKEVGGLQAGLGYRPGEKRAYGPGETVKLVVRVRNAGKEEVKFQYLKEFFIETPPTVTDGDGKPVPLGALDLFGSLVRVPVEVNLTPGKEIDLAELKLEPRSAAQSAHPGQWNLWGTGKFSVQYGQLAHPNVDRILGKLATGKLELVIRFPSELPAAPEKKEPPKQVSGEEKETFTAWGKEVDGLQAGLGFRPGEERAYSHGETVKLVVRVRNVSKEDVKFEYIKAFFIVVPPAVTDAKGKPIPQAGGPISGRTDARTTVNLAPGKEIELYERKLVLGPEFGTGKVQIQYKRVFPPRDPRDEDGSGIAFAGVITLDPTGGKLATGKLELEIKEEVKDPQNQDQKQEKEAFTAWGKELGGRGLHMGKEVDGLQAGLGFRPGEKRAYSHGETVKLVVRVRNVGKKEVTFKYIPAYFFDRPPSVTDGEGKAAPQLRLSSDGHEGEYNPKELTLAPGKEVELAEVRIELRPESECGNKGLKTLYGTGKFQIQYEQVMYSSGKYDIGSILSDLATGKLELEIKPAPPAEKK